VWRLPRRKRGHNSWDAGPGFSFSVKSRNSRGIFARGAIFVRTIMRISARNQIKGSVVEVKKGATTSHVRVDIGGGNILTSSITNEAVDELKIKVGDHVSTVIKASDVMIAVE
jgi:molybdopterin-binding protein